MRTATGITCALLFACPALGQTATATSVLGATWDDSDGNGMVEIGQAVTITVDVEFTDARAFAGYWFDFAVLGGRGNGLATNGEFNPDVTRLTTNTPYADGPVYRNIETAQEVLAALSDNPINLFQYELVATRGGRMTVGTASSPNSGFPGINLYGLDGPIDILFASRGEVINFEEPVTFTIAPAPGAMGPSALLVLSALRRRRRA